MDTQSTKSKRGRRPINGETMDRKALTLDPMTLRKLKVLGNGNLSAGARIAADVAYEQYQKGRLPEVA